MTSKNKETKTVWGARSLNHQQQHFQVEKASKSIVSELVSVFIHQIGEKCKPVLKEFTLATDKWGGRS